MDKYKTGLGYNVVPPPYTGNFMPPKSYLVYPSLDDFVDESVVENPTVETNEPETARKENGAPIIEDWVSDSEEEDVPKVHDRKQIYLTDLLEIDGGFVAALEVFQRRGKLLGRIILIAGFQTIRASEEKKDVKDPGNESGNPTEGKDSEVPSTEEPRINQENDDYINSTNNINTASNGNNTNNVNAVSSTVNDAGTEVNVVDPKTSIELPNDPNMPELEDIVYSGDDEDVGAEADMNNLDAFMPVSPIPTTRIHKDHPVDQIIGDLNSAPQTRRMTKNLKEHGLFSSVQQRTNHKDFQNCLFACFLSQEEPKKIIQALKDPSWIEAMQYRLLQLKLQKVWTLVDLPNGKRAIGTKWVYRNKKDERGIVIKNKARLVAQGKYKRRKGLDYDEVFAPVARIKAIRLFLAYASFKDFVVYQMDVKSAFLYGKIEEEVYVCQPPGFEDPDFPDRMSFMGELTFFLGLQVKQKEDGVFISQDKYVTEILKKFSFSDVKTANTPMETHKPLLKDADGKDVDEYMYRSMIDTLMYLTSSRPDIMFTTVILIHTTEAEAEYVAASSCCGQVLWIQNQLLDYGDSNEKKLIQMIKIHTDKNVADLLTKAFDKGIGVNAGDSKLMLLGINLLLLEKVNAARHNLLLLVFADSHNMVAFLAKPTESKGFEQIVDFLKANPIKYALTVNPIIYTSCIEQFWATTKVETVNGEVQLHALVDRKKLTHMGYEKLSQKLTFYKAFFSPQWKFLIHTILQCLSAKSTAWNKFSSTMASAIICLATNQKFNFSKYIFESMVKNVDSSVKFLMYPRFVQVFLDKQVGDMSTHDEIFITPSHIKKVLEPIADEAATEENVPTQSNDPPLSRVNTLGSGEDKLTLKELIDLCTKLSDRVLDLETTKTAQGKEIASLKKRVKKLERKRKLKTPGMKRLFKIGRSSQVVSSEDEGRYDDAQMFDTYVFNGEEVFVAEQSKKVVSTAEVSDAAKITTEEITFAQALAELRSAKPKVVVQEPVQSTTTTTPSTIPKAKSITFRDPGESTTRPTLTPIPSNIKDKGKAKMIEPEKPLKKTEQIRLDEELAFKLQAKEEEQARLTREKAKEVKEANISWDNVQAMIEADRLLAERLQVREQEESTDEENARLFVELLEKRKKHFAALRAQEKSNKPPTKAQKKSTMSTYLKNMAGYKQSQLKTKSFVEIQKLFDKAMTRRASDELEQDKEKKQNINDDQEEVEMKKLIKVVPDEEEVAINVIPLATKPPRIVDWKIVKEGKISLFQIIRANGSSRRYSSMIQMLRDFDREDLETLWKLVKAKHGSTRPEEGYERVL
ncbi:putative ribonuclease H-like domain-containing protein [Tanacetum coccineum]